MTGFRRVRRRVVAALVGAAVLVSLSGCWVADLADLVPTPGPTPSGHADQLSREQAAALIEQVPGVDLTSVGTQVSGLVHNTVVEVYVDDPAVAESPQFVEFLFAVGWATTIEKPSLVYLVVRRPGSGQPVELQAQVNSIFGVERKQLSIESASLDAGPLESRWGPWPGAIPEVPVVASPAPE